MNLNERALGLVEALLARSEERRVVASRIEGGGRVVDCGIEARGGLRAGLDLARICLADLAEVGLVPGEVQGRPLPGGPGRHRSSRGRLPGQPVRRLGAQPGEVLRDGLRPDVRRAGREPILERLGVREEAAAVVGVLEGRKLPTPAVVAQVAEACRVPPEAVTLLIAPTASLAGGVQVVARSVETALHKLAEVGFDLARIVSAQGSAPLPPVAENDLAAIGRTNDAILYGARVVLFVTGDDDSLREVGPKVPSSSSRDYGEPFAAIFARYHHDFYAVDPHLFSPAEVVFQNVNTGRVHGFGQTAPDVLTRSFFQG